MFIVSVREQPEYARDTIEYFQKQWATEESKKLYEDCITSCLVSSSPLPQWYLLHHENKIAGCAGLITNDFISRMDLWPWLCGLYIEEEHRGHGCGALLIKHIKAETRERGFSHLYLCTDHIGYYERYGFGYVAQGYHPWGEESRIYQADLL